MQVWNIILIFLTFFFLTYCAHNTEHVTEKVEEVPAQAQQFEGQDIVSEDYDTAGLDKKMEEAINKLDVRKFQAKPPVSKRVAKKVVKKNPEKPMEVVRMDKVVEPVAEPPSVEQEPVEPLEASMGAGQGNNGRLHVLFLILATLGAGLVALYFFVRRRNQSTEDIS